MTKSQQMKAKLKEMKVEAKALLDKEGVSAAEINAKRKEIEDYKAKIVMQEELEEEERNNPTNPAPLKPTAGGGDNEPTYKNTFYKALKGKTLSAKESELIVKNSLSSDTGEDGGFLIPVDQRTTIKELKRELKGLEQYVNIENVSTNSGSRNIEKDAEHTPFTEFTEGSKVGDTNTPQWKKVEYTIKDRGGILKIPNNLMSDNNANLEQYLNKWLAKKQVATRNSLILGKLATLSKTTITGIDDIKDILNEKLDPSIKEISAIYMNQTVFNKYSKLKDANGNYLLEKDPTKPTTRLIEGRPIIVISNRTLKNVNNKAPLYIGALKEAITLFDRQAMSLLATQHGDAFNFNRTDIRAITREDVQLVDTESIVAAEMDITVVE